jgi:hypothetical protein
MKVANAAKKPLTAEIAKKSRRERQGSLLVLHFFAPFAAFVGDLCG